MKTGWRRLSCGEASFEPASSQRGDKQVTFAGASGLVSADPHLETGAEGERQRRVADGADVLVVQQVLSLHEYREAVGDVEGAAEIELSVGEVEVAVGQQQRVVEVGGEAVEEGGVVAAAGVAAEEGDGELGPQVLRGGEAGLRWPAEDARADKWALRADGNAGDVGIFGRHALVGSNGV